MSNEHLLTGLGADDPLAFLAAIGLLRLVSRKDATATLSWRRAGRWIAVLNTTIEDLPGFVVDDLQRWPKHPAIAFAVDADEKVVDLKHPPEALRAYLRECLTRPGAFDREEADFFAAFSTGVAVDGTGQTKPTALHFNAGQQRFMSQVHANLPLIDAASVTEALFGPWTGTDRAKTLRWRAAAARSRALLSFNPGPVKDTHIPGAEWLAFQALPLFPTAPVGARIVTTCFTGRGKHYRMTWPVWSTGLPVGALRYLLSRRDLDRLSASERAAIGVVEVLRSDVQRSDQGYGSFTSATPVSS
jgi:hypothetical protein